jgi:hypothetical protein
MGNKGGKIKYFSRIEWCSENKNSNAGNLLLIYGILSVGECHGKLFIFL